MARAVFDAYVMLDWSAESRPKTGPDSIWWVCRETGHPCRGPVNPPTRARAMADLADLLSDLLARGKSVLLGVDLALGYPRGFAQALGVADWKGVWGYLDRLIRDDLANANNRFKVASDLNQALTGGASPFWGCPDSARTFNLAPTKPAVFPFAELRQADKAAVSAKSVWQLAYAGSVGSQTLLGLPHLRQLRFHPWLADHARVWPFETGLRPLDPAHGPRIVMAEIYPALIPVPAQGVRDCAQVQAMADHCADLDGRGQLAGLFAGPANLSADDRAAIEQEEGWILGAGGWQAPRAETSHDWIKDPAAIYRQSFATIRGEVDFSGLSPAMADVAVRVIHACGMTEIARDLIFSPGAAEAGQAALAHGAPILVDAQMVAHGIIRRRLPKDNPVICTLDAMGQAQRAAENGTTRSAQAVDDWLPHLDGAVVAIGNAPTALFRLLELIRDGAPRPAVILGFAVGFVGAVESKDALAASGLPHIALLGRKGGSAMAAAAVNALAGGLA